MSSANTFTLVVPRAIQQDLAFTNWLTDLDGSLFEKVEAAIVKINNEGVVTNVKNLQHGLYEKKWHSGLRMYFSVIEFNEKKTLLILGSGKGRDQNWAILKARDILKIYNNCT